MAIIYLYPFNYPLSSDCSLVTYANDMDYALLESCLNFVNSRTYNLQKQVLQPDISPSIAFFSYINIYTYIHTYIYIQKYRYINKDVDIHNTYIYILCKDIWIYGYMDYMDYVKQKYFM